MSGGEPLFLAEQVIQPEPNRISGSDYPKERLVLEIRTLATTFNTALKTVSCNSHHPRPQTKTHMIQDLPTFNNDLFRIT
jgi:hypothetical protein